jgi:hypothetical protein
MVADEEFVGDTFPIGGLVRGVMIRPGACL